MKLGRLRIPSVMMVALIASLTSTILMCWAWLVLKKPVEDPDFDRYLRLVMLDGVANFVMRAAIVAGLVETAARLTGTKRQLLLAAAWMVAIVTFWRVAGFQLVTLVVKPTTPDGSLFHVIDQGFSVTLLVATIAIAIAVRGAPAFTSAAIVALFIGPALPVVGPAFRDLMGKSSPLGVGVTGIGELCWVVGLAGMLGALLVDRPDEAEPHIAARGFRRIEAGLLVRAASPIVILFTSLLISHTSAGLKVAILLGGVVTSTAWLLIGAGVFTAARAGVAGLSPARLYPGGALVLGWGALTLVQFLATYAHLFVQHSGIGDQAQVLTLAGPIVAIGGLLLLGAAVGSFARARGDEDLRESALARTIIIVVIDASVLAIAHQVSKGAARDIALIVLVAATIAAVIGTLSFAKLFRRAAVVAESMPALPSARLVIKETK